MTPRARAYARWEHARTPGCEPESAAKLSPREGTHGAFVSESSFVQKSTAKHLRRVYLRSPVAVSSSPFSQQRPSTANHAGTPLTAAHATFPHPRGRRKCLERERSITTKRHATVHGHHVIFGIRGSEVALDVRHVLPVCKYSPWPPRAAI